MLYVTSPPECPRLYYEFHPASSPPVLPRPQVDPSTSCSYDKACPLSSVPRHLIDNGKETILFIHIWTSDCTTFRNQVLDPQLRERYNMVLYDQRYHGRTREPSSPIDSNPDPASPNVAHDLWSAAVEAVMVMNYLGIERFHVFSAYAPSMCIAIRMCVLFPGRVMSIFSDGHGWLQEESAYVKRVLGEIGKAMCAPEDESEYYDGIDEALYFAQGGREALTVDQYDLMAASLMTAHPPSRSTNCKVICDAFLKREPIPEEGLKRVTCPLYVLHGEYDVAYPVEAAEELKDLLPLVPGGVKLEVIEGPACSYAANSELVNSKYLSWLLSLPPPLPASQNSLSHAQQLLSALSFLSNLLGSPSVADRNPNDPLSFSAFSPAALEQARLELSFIEGANAEAKGWWTPELEALSIPTWQDVDYETRFHWRFSRRDYYGPSTSNVPINSVSLIEMSSNGFQIEVQEVDANSEVEKVEEYVNGEEVEGYVDSEEVEEYVDIEEAVEYVEE